MAQKKRSQRIDTPVSIEGAPLEELFKAIVGLSPKCMEIYGFAYGSVPIDLPLEGFGRNPPQALNRRIAVRRRCYDYFEPELRKGKDGGLYIQMGCNGVELHLGEKDAMDFIAYVREWRKELNRAFAQSALDFLDQPTP